MSDAFSVLVDGEDRLDLKAIGQILSWFRKIPVQDSQRMAKYCWGIVADDLERSGADDLTARLKEAGVPAFPLKTELVASLAPAKLAARGKLTEDSVAFDLRDGSAETVAFSRVAVLATAAFEESEIHKVKTDEGPTSAQQAMNVGVMMATGLPIKLGQQKRKVEREVESRDLVFYMDLVLENPDARIRIDGQKFDYSLLGAKKQYNVLGNIKALTAEFAARAPKARRSKGTRVLLEGKPVREMGYTGLTDLERESRWLLTLARKAGGA